ncbi:MAG: hypothetical protein IJS89_08795 [Bacteroidaceae bacterium]|nr:hypothetical protein [Bacteroidaceae bacterium]
MDNNYIAQLLDRYFDCTATASEERMLRAYFSGNDVPAELARYKALFDVQEEAAKETVSADFADRVLKKAGISPVVEARPRTFSLRIALRPLYNAVAAIAIVMLVGHLAQISFGTSADQNGAMEVAATEQIDSTGTTTLDHIKAVGDGQKTATLGDSLNAPVPERAATEKRP